MAVSDFRDPFLAALAPRLAALEPRARAAAADLPPARIAAVPASGGWSIAQVLEHLCLGNEAYLPAMAAALDRARRGSPRRHGRSFFGRLLLGAIAESNPRKLPTTRAMTPRAVRAGVLDAFLASLARLESLAHRADGADLGAGMWSPIAPIRLNLGDAFDVLVTHAERHLAQAERVRREIGA